MPELRKGLFFSSSNDTTSDVILSQCNSTKGKDNYLASVNPLLESKCATCHSSLSFRIIRGGAEANYTFAKKKGSDVVEYASGRKPHPGGTVLDASDELLINRWLVLEAECRATKAPVNAEAVCSITTRPVEVNVPGNHSNVARASGSGLFLRVGTLFPGQTINEKEFSLFESSGLNKALALPQRFTSVSAQIAFLAKIENYCNAGVRTPKNSAGNLFGDFQLSGETRPTDIDTRDVLFLARNIWLYPYAANSKEIVELQKAYSDSVAAVRIEGKSVDESKKIGKITVCMTALQSPQFWLGNSGSFDVLRKTAIEVGRVIPTASDFDGLKTSTDRTQWMKKYVANLQKSGTGYLSAIKYWHQDWLGTRPFNNANFNTDGSYSARNPRPIWTGYNLFTDTFAHGKILDQFRCGTPDQAEAGLAGLAGYSEDVAYPKGYTSESSTATPDQALLNALAFNMHYQNGALAAGEEKTALDALDTDFSEDASRLIAHVLQDDLDYREILLANYTFGTDSFKQLLSTQNFTLPFRTANTELSSSPNTVKKILASSLGPLNRRWLSGTPNSWCLLLREFVPYRCELSRDSPART